jgi:LysM repeat protein
MKKLLIIFSFLVCNNISSQNHTTHEVKLGETIEEIAKTYMVTPFDIYALNPDIDSKLKPKTQLIIPVSKLLDVPVEVKKEKIDGYIFHKVKRKETLFSIAKKYGLSVDDLKKYNVYLYSENLRKGDKLQIPKFTTVKTLSKLVNTIKKYEVLPKEGKWRIAYKFGISVSELEGLNPHKLDSLQVGQEINVPNIGANKERIIEDNYDYYTVLAKEGFYRLKIKLGLDKNQIIVLNPELKGTNLREGMILKVPRNILYKHGLSNTNYTALADKIVNLKEKRMAVMIPFQLNRIDFDSIHIVKKQIQNDRLLNISIDFYSGVLMALDSLKQLGLTTNVDVYDTEARLSKISEIINKNDFSKYDAVIGPFISNNFERAATLLKRDNVPIVSPLTIPKNLYENVFQTIPSDTYLINKMVNFIKQDTSKYTMIVIADDGHRATSNSIKSQFSQANQIFSRKNEEGKESFYILKEDIEELLPEGKSYVFLETANEGFVSNVSSMLNGFNGINIVKAESEEEEDEEIEREIIMVTSNRNSRAYEGGNVSNFDLSNLQFHYASYNMKYNLENSKTFVNNYERIYGGLPSKYAIRGYDLTMDVLLRLASAKNLYEATNDAIETRYIENKFRYSKKLFGGYYNDAAFIAKYEDLNIIEIRQ